MSPVYDLRTTWPYTEGGDGIPFERSSYPGPHCRWNGDRWKPLWFWEEEKRAAADGWKATRRFISSSRATAIGIAQEFLSQAVVLVEGEIFVACTEPVWAFDPYEDQRERLRLDRSPTTRMAMGKFSLDRLAAAEEWCRRRGGDPTPHGSADVLVPNALGRDDDWELANCVLDRLRHLPRAYPGSDPDVWEAVRSLSDQWDVRDGRIPRDRAGELLEAVHGVVLSLDTLGKGRYDWVEKDLMLLAERWAAVREDWLHQQLDEDDLAALCERFD